MKSPFDKFKRGKRADMDGDGRGYERGRKPKPPKVPNKPRKPRRKK